MPKGIPVATVAIGNSTNAALLALRMLAIGDAKLNKVLQGEERDLKTKVKDMNKRIKKVVTK
jgi:phosphoribosylcarboxyaminoimidazole (NCAIR) mutase